MNKLVIVGHPTSSYNIVEEAFHSYGMQKAKPSRRENYLPDEINTILCQSHGILNPRLPNLESQYQQLEIGSVWHGMALDLMLGNLDNSIWGWADEQAIFLLNYWRDLDPEIIFVLVYSKPDDILLKSDPSIINTSSALQNAIDQWINYNEAILHFFNRNKDRCFLVNSSQAQKTSHQYLIEISRRLNAPWLDKLNDQADVTTMHLDDDDAHDEDSNDTNSFDVMHLDDTIQTAVHKDSQAYDIESLNIERFIKTIDADTNESSQLQINQTHLITKPIEKPLTTFLSQLILSQTPKLAEVYEDLESSSNFPLDEDKNNFKDQFSQNAFNAWLEMQNQQNALEALNETALQLTQEKNQLLSEIAKLDEIPKLNQENKILSLQLCQVQDQIKKNMLNTQQLVLEKEGFSNEIPKLNKEKNELSQQLEQTKSLLESNKAALAKLELESKEKLLVVPDLEEENNLILAQLHHVQEELERFNLENQALKEKNRLDNPPIVGFSAEQIKMQLAYRLGQRLINQSKTLTGALTLPLGLIFEAIRYKKNQLNNPNLAQQTLSDYEKNRVEAVKNHLSYQLGIVLTSNIKNPLKWLLIPFKMIKTAKQFKAKKQ